MAYKKVKTTGTGGPNRFYTRAEAKSGARVRRRREDKKVAGWAPGQPWEIGDIDALENALENTLKDEEE